MKIYFLYVKHVKKNLCPNCKNNHDKSHNILDYEQDQLYCNNHFNLYNFYCNDCKKDLCTTCKNEHENHEIISYDDIIPDIEKIKDNELKDTKEKIYELKTVINRMISQLNKLNRNLDTYFEIFNNIICNFDKEQRNYSFIQNVNYIKSFNTNFIGNITEIIRDDNLKSQFVNIINMQLKMEFKKENNTIIIQEKEDKEKNENNNNDTNDNINKYNLSDDKYENFHLDQIKELQSFTINNKIENILVLNDGRILTIQRYSNESGKKLYKLCVYSIINEFICDINIDIEKVKNIFRMEDGNVAIYTDNNFIKIIKVKKNNMEEIFKLEGMDEMKSLSNDYFYVYQKEDTGERIQSAWFLKGKELPRYVYNYYIYLYEKEQFKKYINITDIYEKENVINICQINNNEFVLFTRQKIKILGKYDFLLYYDAKNNKILKKIKIGKKDEHYWDKTNMYYHGNDNLILERDSISGPKFLLVDIKKGDIKNEFHFEIDVRNCIYLNEKIFLSNYYGELYLCEFENSKTISLKEKKNMHCIIALKYFGNKIIACGEKKITLFG